MPQHRAFGLLNSADPVFQCITEINIIYKVQNFNFMVCHISHKYSVIEIRMLVMGKYVDWIQTVMDTPMLSWTVQPQTQTV